MASPVAHSLAGLVVFYLRRGIGTTKNNRTLFWLCLFMALSPDLDFLPGVLQGSPALYHQGFSHSLAFGVAASFFVAFLTQSKYQGSWVKIWGLFFLAYSSHLGIDLLGRDARPPFGIPLFWPWTDEHFLAPFSIFWGVRHAGHTLMNVDQWIASILSMYNVGAILVEIFIFLPVMLLVRFFNGHFLKN